MPSKSSSRGSGPNNPTKAAASKANGALKAATGNSQAKPVDLFPTSTSGNMSAKDSSVDKASAAGRPVTGNDAAPGSNEAPTVNRKKQKRRQKQAARLAAAEQHFPAAAGGQGQAYVDARDTPYHELAHGRSTTQAQTGTNGYDYGTSDYDDPDQYEPGEGEDLYYTDEDDRLLEKPYSGMRSNGYSTNNPVPHEDSRNKAKRKKKSKSSVTPQPGYSNNHNASNPPPKTPSATHQQVPPPPPPGLSSAALRSAHHISKDRIWNTSTAEERERIKEFWLSLGEEERRSLVKVEKEAVLKKMKEQQKHSCSCTVCGRKRTAIEEELEVLYDAYYEELEQYANHQQINLADGAPIIPPPRLYGQHMGRMPPGQRMQGTNTVRSSRGRIQEVTDDDDEADEEEYSDDEEEEYSEEEVEEPIGSAADFFNFGNSLTVQGGILTVADDLLKNDGKKFIEMMEQLAERRMQREEEAQYAASRYPSMQSHNHGHTLNDDDEDYDDEGDEEEYSDDDDDYEEDEMEAMTEEQRMEEGRRMFQIFAARMFEQRVLTAYREKVARERQQKLLEELDEESRLDTLREAKKAKDAQKKKDKKRQQKQAKDEEKAKREAEKAAEEAALKAIEDKKLEEQRQKKEEQRKKKEAEKKAQEEERQRKEAEKQKRLREAREQQAEQERKQREQKEREKKKRDEAKKKEREEREAKEQQLRARKERETTEKVDREAKAKLEKEDTERKRKDEQTAKHPAPAAPAVPNFPQSKPSIPSSAAPPSAGLQLPQPTSSHASPHLQIATPVIPKAPTPIRSRQTSFQGSHTSSPKASLPPTEGSTTSPSVPLQARNVATVQPVKAANAPPSSQLPQRTPSFTPVSGPPPPTQPPGLSSVPTAAGNGFHSNISSMMPKVAQRGPVPESSMFSQQPPYNGYRPFMAPNPSAYPPGLGGPTPLRPFPQGRGGPVESSAVHMSTGPPIGPMSAAHNPSQYNMHRDNMPPHPSHSRQSSASLENSIPSQAQPIARPAPIQRPSSTAPQQQGESYRKAVHTDVDDLSNHLGSSALLDDTDVPLSSNTTHSRRGSMAPGAPRSGGSGFAGVPAFQDPIGTAKPDNFGRVQIGTGIGIAWNSPEMPSNGHQMSGSGNWSNAPRPGWPNNNAFGILGGSARSSGSRAVTIRLLVVQACSKLSAHPPADSRYGFHNIDTVLNQVELMKPHHEEQISMKEMLDICDTEGNTQNGGGSFIIEHHEPHTYVKFEPGRNTSIGMSGGVGPGDIGSPVPVGAMPAFGGGRGFAQHGNIMSSSGF